MAAICNVSVPLTEDKLQLKKHLAWSAAGDVAAALGDLFRQIEVELISARREYEPIYLRASLERFRMARSSLLQVAALLETCEPTAEVTEWYQNFDYARFYASAAAAGQLPGWRDIWDELGDTIRQGGPLGVARLLLSELDDTIAACADGRTLDFRSQALRFACLAQQVAVLNDVEPLDPSWLRTPCTASLLTHP